MHTKKPAFYPGANQGEKMCACACGMRGTTYYTDNRLFLKIPEPNFKLQEIKTHTDSPTKKLLLYELLVNRGNVFFCKILDIIKTV